MPARAFLRIVTLLLIAAFGALAVTGAVVPADDGCSEPCPGEGEDQECPADCQFCVCCPSALRAVAARAVLTFATPSVGRTPPSWCSLLAPTPALDEIRHVPKPALA